MDPEDCFSRLKSKLLSSRARSNLQIVHEICREISDLKNDKDFSPTSVGRKTAAKGGPKPNTLLSPGGKHFRTLIAAWAAHSGGTTSRRNYSNAATKDDVLDHITEPRLRALIGPVLRENRQLKAEVNLLKANANITFDCLPVTTKTAVAANATNSNYDSLLESERDALSSLFVSRALVRRGLTIGTNGEVIATRPIRPGQDVLPVGFFSGLQKLIGSQPNVQ